MRLEAESNLTKASSFTDLSTAETAVTETLRQNREAVLAFDVGGPKVIKLSATFERPLGKVLERSGDFYLGRTCVVILRRDASGGYVKTAWLER